MTPRIPIEEIGWRLNPDTCPPDIHFIDYLKEYPLPSYPVSIFHMGCGFHHWVGTWAATQKNIFVRSLSITPVEIDHYIELATENPELNFKYQVDFGDIHVISSALIPRFDFITLFHLGEISEQIKDPEYPGRSIPSVIRMFAERLQPGGEMLFFSGSSAWFKVFDIVKLILGVENNWHETTYKSLVIYRKQEDM